MIVKTSVFNPTAIKQSYSWVPPTGIHIAPGGEFVMNGDMYTRNLLAKMPGNIIQMGTDVANGRAVITLITDIAVRSPDSPIGPREPGVEEPKKVVAVAKPAAKPAPVKITREEVSLADLSKIESESEDEENDNLLGKGLVEVKDAPTAVYDAVTGEKRDDSGYPDKAENMSDYLWGDKKNDDFIAKESFNTADVPSNDTMVKKAVQTAQKSEGDPSKQISRGALKKMGLTSLRALAAKKGMADMAKDAEKPDLIDWIYDNQ